MLLERKMIRLGTIAAAPEGTCFETDWLNSVAKPRIWASDQPRFCLASSTKGLDRFCELSRQRCIMGVVGVHSEASRA